MEAVAEFAAAGGPVLGICNGFQVLCEAGLLPGALLPNEALRFVCRQVDWSSRTRDAVHAAASGRVLSIPVKHATAATSRRTTMLDELEANGQVVFRYAPGQNPNGSARDIAGVTQRGGQRLRPDAAPRARGRSADRLGRRPEAVRALACAARTGCGAA